MPHLHTEPNQHDVTTSAWIFRREGDDLKVLVHMHRKVKKYMEVGGHIELDETPWQTMAHELKEESGYTLADLEIYQPDYMPIELNIPVTHPVPMFLNTYQPLPGHYHTDICYAFYANELPPDAPAEGESQDIRWFTVAELESGVEHGDVHRDVAETYRAITRVIEQPYIHKIATSNFSFGKPRLDEAGIEKVAAVPSLEITRFGNPVLREKAKRLTAEEITSTATQSLIKAIFNKLSGNQYGVGLAAPQVGESIALSVIGIKPTPTRPNLEKFNTVIINPSYEGVGGLVEKWEGCVSCGTGSDTLYAQVPRFDRIQAKWLDEKAMQHEETLHGFVAHVFQHETDHLNGVLFVDRVKDPTTYIMGDEYRKRVVREQ